MRGTACLPLTIVRSSSPQQHPNIDSRRQARPSSEINAFQPVLLALHLSRQVFQRLDGSIPEPADSRLDVGAKHGDDLVAIAHQRYRSGRADIDFLATRAQRRFPPSEFDHHRFIHHPIRPSKRLPEATGLQPPFMPSLAGPAVSMRPALSFTMATYMAWHSTRRRELVKCFSCGHRL